MHARSGIGGVICFTLGLIVGGVVVYARLRPAMESRTGLLPSDLPPTPAEADGRVRLQAVLTHGGLDAAVVVFRRTDWHHYTIPMGATDNTGKLAVLEVPYLGYRIAYEAEVEFHREGQIKENFTVMWVPGNTANGEAPTMTRHEVGSLRSGERRAVRGTLHWKLVGSEWQGDPKDKIDRP